MNASYCKPTRLRRLARLLLVLLPLAVFVFCLHILAQDTQAIGTPPHLQINELMAKNLSSITGQDGQPVDWLEIYNPTDQPFSMEGVGLSDKPGDPYRWVFPEYTLEPGEHLLVYADGQNCTDESGFHTDFMLSGRGGTLLLTAPDGELLDRLVYPEQHWDIPYGRLDQNAETQGFFAAATPGKANPAAFWGGQDTPLSGLAEIQFSVPAGTYDAPFTLYLSSDEPDALILYTTDGSEPSVTSRPYINGIPIREQSSSSALPKGTVVRARLYKEGRLGEEVFTGTYFVNTTHDFPVVSISTDSRLLYDERDGLLSGRSLVLDPLDEDLPLSQIQLDSIANYLTDQRVPVNFEYRLTDGQTLTNGTGSLRIAGKTSRNATMKSMIVSLDDGSSFKLRTQDTLYDAFYYFPYLNHMWSNEFSALEIFASSCEFVEVYIDGDYRGIYSLQKTTTDMISQASGISKKDLYIVKDFYNFYAVAGGQDALDELEAFYQEILSRDFSNSEDYAWLERQMDIDEFIRYLLAALYIRDNDFGVNNIGLWRSASASDTSGLCDGRWRFFLYDMDHSTSAVFVDSLNALMATDFLDESVPAEERIAHLKMIADRFAENGSSEIFRILLCKLWLSATFQEKLWSAAQEAYAPDGFYSAAKMSEVVYNHYLELEPAMPRLFTWLYGSSERDAYMQLWAETMLRIMAFTDERTEYMLWFIKRSCFLLK